MTFSGGIHILCQNFRGGQGFKSAPVKLFLIPSLSATYYDHKFESNADTVLKIKTNKPLHLVTLISLYVNLARSQ